MKPISTAWRLAAVTLVAGLLLILVLNVITQPVASEQRSYTADFTDVAGLHSGADVRVRGVRVGKVDSIALRRSEGRSIAQVAFMLDSRFSIGTDSTLAIKYQALTGLRYLDVVDASQQDAAESIKHIPTSMTVPSFDITKVFNGLQPVLETLSPEDFNTFTTNVEAFLAGDGSGLGPVLESVHTISRFAADRQQVVELLLHNLKAMADSLGGHAKEFIQIVDWANRPMNAAMDVLDEFRKSEVYGPAFGNAITRLLHNAGLKEGIDIDEAMDKAITNLDDFVSAIKLMPAVWENIPPPGQVGEPLGCSKGRAELPLPVDVLLNGRKVVLCKQ
jgi:phospholipid/cholesterol/gamma-HCH transport system substrate-binding protein